MENTRDKVGILDQKYSEIINRKDMIFLKDEQICLIKHNLFEYIIGIEWYHTNHILKIFKVNPISIFHNDPIFGLSEKKYLLINPHEEYYCRLLEIAVDINSKTFVVSQIRKPLIDNLDFKIINLLK